MIFLSKNKIEFITICVSIEQKNLVLKLNKTQIIINQKIKKLINGQTHYNIYSKHNIYNVGDLRKIFNSFS